MHAGPWIMSMEGYLDGSSGPDGDAKQMKSYGADEGGGFRPTVPSGAGSDLGWEANRERWGRPRRKMGG